jgi:hypothetical protein
MPCILSTGFALDCRDSIGGVDEIYIGELEYLNTATFATSAGAVTIMAMTGGKKFYKYELRRNTAEAKSDNAGEVTSGSGYIMQSVTIQLDKFDVAKRNEIRVLAQKPLIFIVKDKNDLYSVFGAYNGLDLSTGTAGTGKSASDLNGFVLTFSGEERTYPLGVSSAIVTTLI